MVAIHAAESAVKAGVSMSIGQRCNPAEYVLERLPHLGIIALVPAKFQPTNSSRRRCLLASTG